MLRPRRGRGRGRGHRRNALPASRIPASSAVAGPDRPAAVVPRNCDRPRAVVRPRPVRGEGNRSLRGGRTVGPRVGLRVRDSEPHAVDRFPARSAAPARRPPRPGGSRAADSSRSPSRRCKSAVGPRKHLPKRPGDRVRARTGIASRLSRPATGRSPSAEGSDTVESTRRNIPRCRAVSSCAAAAAADAANSTPATLAPSNTRR